MINSVIAGCYRYADFRDIATTPSCFYREDNACVSTISFDNRCKENYKIYNLNNCRIEDENFGIPRSTELIPLIHEDFIEIPSNWSIRLSFLGGDSFGISDFWSDNSSLFANLICDSEYINKTSFHLFLSDSKQNYEMKGVYGELSDLERNLKRQNPPAKGLIITLVTVVLAFLLLGVWIYFGFIKKKKMKKKSKLH